VEASEERVPYLCKKRKAASSPVYYRLTVQGMFDPGLGSARNSPEAVESKMTGTPSQIEWAERIKPRVNAEFDRVAKAFKAMASHQGELARMDTQAIIAILEEKRAEAMANSQAGYFIRDRRELRDQVRQMMARDARYQVIKANKAARRR
jgi:hypothetical protein